MEKKLLIPFSEITVKQHKKAPYIHERKYFLTRTHFVIDRYIHMSGRTLTSFV